MLIVLLGWGYVVVMMALAEASGPGGSLLGALVTLVLYGVLPLSIVLYIGGARARWRARARLRDAQRARSGSSGPPVDHSDASGRVDQRPPG